MIIPVKKIRIITFKNNEKYFMDTIQKTGKIMLNNKSNKYGEIIDEQELKRIEKAISILDNYEKKKFFQYREIKEVEFNSIETKAGKLLDTTIDLSEANEFLIKDNKEKKTTIDLLKPFEKLDVTIKEISQTDKVKIFLGYFNSQVILNEIKLVKSFVEEIGVSNDKRYVSIVTDINEKENILNKLKLVGFTEVNLPFLDSLISDEIVNLELKTSENERLITDNYEKLKVISNELDCLKTYYDYKYNQIIKDKVEVFKTEQTIYFEGWIPETDLEEFEREINEKINCEVEIIDANDDDNIPTYTRNNRFVSKFETITNMYSVPNKNEIDPNPIMSFWYWIIFGLMMGDIGYGLGMIVFFGLFIKFKKPKGELRKLAFVFAYSGISSTFFGILFGSLFGVRFDLLNAIGNILGINGLTSIILEPVDEPLPMLIVSLVLGIAHIVTGLIIKTVIEIKNKRVQGALADGISWILILIGLILFVTISPKLIGIISVITGVVLIILFKGFDKKGFLNKSLSGLGGLYGVTNYLSDVLSYSRILALSLSTAVIAFTMNLLAGMVSGGVIGYIFAIIIYLIGHIFNFVMGLLSAYVHDGRLQYLEFFGKFYEGGGTLFVPFEYELKYIDKINKGEK